MFNATTGKNELEKICLTTHAKIIRDALKRIKLMKAVN